MMTIREYKRAETLEEAWQLNQKKANRVLGGMIWLKMENINVGTAIDLSGLGLDAIEETEDGFSIGAMVTLRQLEEHPGLAAYTRGAVKEALRRGFEDFLLLGVMGARLDHTLANVGILLMLDAANKPAVAVDDYSEMRIVSREPAHVQDDCPYFSLLNVSGLARGVTIRGAKFPLEDGEITCEYQYATSNEVLPGQTAEITVKEGRLLLIEVRRP